MIIPSLDKPDKRYGVIYADPPWHFKVWSDKGTGRSAVSHYDCMELSDLQLLPVVNLAADDCVLFMWATDPMLPEAIELIKAWGFEYKTVGFYWVKSIHTANRSWRKINSEEDFFTGMGRWTRANPEQCLLAVRGKPKRLSGAVRRLCIDNIREHSRKPEQIRDRIEQLVGGPYIELFARETKPGWDCWGMEAGRLDKLGVETRRQPSRLVHH